MEKLSYLILRHTFDVVYLRLLKSEKFTQRAREQRRRTAGAHTAGGQLMLRPHRPHYRVDRSFFIFVSLTGYS